jgi:hypothetical protein
MKNRTAAQRPRGERHEREQHALQCWRAEQQRDAADECGGWAAPDASAKAPSISAREWLN